MASILAAQLDELMGKDRNLPPDAKVKKGHWSDAQICKHYLVDFCPYEVFLNTKFDMGYCDKTHDEPLKQKYRESSRYRKMGYEEDFLRFLENSIADVERKIKRGHARLAINDSQNNIKIQQVVKDNEERVRVIQERIDELLGRVERLGTEGKVEEASLAIKEVEKLNFERDKCKIEIDNAKALERHMRVCEICGAFLIINDAPIRVEDHNMGKQHSGFVKVRAAASKLREEIYGKDSKPERRSEERSLKLSDSKLDQEITFAALTWPGSEPTSTNQNSSRMTNTPINDNHHREKRSRSRSRHRHGSSRHRRDDYHDADDNSGARNNHVAPGASRRRREDESYTSARGGDDFDEIGSEERRSHKHHKKHHKSSHHKSTTTHKGRSGSSRHNE